jgi:flagellar M-ring protein FliF
MENEKKQNPINMVKDMIISWPMSVKIMAGVLMITFIIIGSVYNNYKSEIEFISLYDKEISSGQIDEIVNVLNQKGFRQGIEFDIKKNEKSSSLVVQKRIAGLVREKLDKEGYPKNEDIVGSANITTTEDERKRIERMQQEQSLAEQIRQMDGIKNVTVNIVPEQEGVFEEDLKPAKASVTVTLKDGFALSSMETKSIMNIISGAVKGLDNKNVNVIGTDGKIYSDRVLAEEDPNGTIPLDVQASRQKDLQDSLTRNAQNFLDGILGPGKSKVSVNAVLNFDGVEREMLVYGNPLSGGAVPVSGGEGTLTIGGTVVNVKNKNKGYKTVGDEVAPPPSGVHVVSMEKIKEKYDNKNKKETTDGTGYENLEERINYQIDESKTRVVQATGKIERLTVALALDSVPEQYEEDLKNIVAATVGVDENRGDMIVVTNMPFGGVREVIPVVRPIGTEQVNHNNNLLNPATVRYGAALFVMLTAIMLAIYFGKQQKSNKEKTKLNLTVSPLMGMNTITGLDSDKGGRTVSPLNNNTTNQTLTNWATERPNEIADLLKKSWLKA